MQNIKPSLESYQSSTAHFNVIPVSKTIRADFETPVSLFVKVKGESLLESVEQGENVGRYSFITIGKKVIFTIDGNNITVSGPSAKQFLGTEKESFVLDNPLIKVREFFQSKKMKEDPSLPPFFAGAIGYLGYETIHFFEKIPVLNSEKIVPDGILFVPEIVLAYDILQKSLAIIVTTFPEENDCDCYYEAVQKIEAIEKLIAGPLAPPTEKHNSEQSTIYSNFTKEQYIEAVHKIKERITEGDIIQCVLSQRFEMKTNASPFDLYRTLRIMNPSPYLFFLDFEDFCVIGSSPEVMVRCREGELLLKPIAGTRPRGKTIEEDAALAKDLLADPKERAEHLMLVDLGRNDLGRVSIPGSVEVTDYMAIERYSHVMHIVSTIKSRIKAPFDIFDLIRATFPAGTLTGAPKIKAMEILSHLENQRRGPYGGMVVNLGFNGNMDSCITIRTIVYKNETAYIQAGAGIVADSDPESEYQETVNKARALVNTVKHAS